MNLKARTRANLRILASVTLVAMAAAAVFNFLTNEEGIETVPQGLLDGLLISLGAGGYIVFVKNGLLRQYFARRTFSQGLALNASVYLILFLGFRAMGQLLTSGDPARAYQSFADTELLAATPFFFVLALAFEFIIQMNRMLGMNVLRYYLTGAYHRPVEEDRIFMFLDLKGSTSLAEELGAERFYAMLRRFVDDLSEPILETGGEIYQYAGDEVVITWKREAGLRNANCLRCFFRIEDAIDEQKTAYIADFGAVPRFRAGVHGGKVIAGELGDLKQEIVFVGDIVNTAARLEEYAKLHKKSLVASDFIVGQLGAGDGVRTELLESFVPRGKERSIEVHEVHRSAHVEGLV